jgi:hypothetical protein
MILAEAAILHLSHRRGIRITAVSYGVDRIYNLALRGWKSGLLHPNNEAHDSLFFLV